MLNIKDPEAHRLAKELAAVEGTTMTEAVTSALRGALEEHDHQRRVKRELLLGIIAAARSRDDHPVTDPFEDLYDPTTGLPR